MKRKLLTILFFAIILFILVLLFLYSRTQIENFTENKPQCWALTFGGGGQNFYDAVQRIRGELSNTQFFDNIVSYTDKDLKNDASFWNTHQDFIENNKRGYGYWIWKPYIILKTLKQMQEGEILFYLDVGCEVKNETDGKSKLLEMVRACDKHDILYTSTNHDTKSYTKMDLLEHMNMNKHSIKDSTMHQAGLLCIKNIPTTRNMVKEWYQIASQYRLLDDTASSAPNDPTFIEHRHDQAIFSLLIKSDKYKNRMDTPANLLNDYSPFLLSRKKTG
jgi:hypothetical protein